MRLTRRLLYLALLIALALALGTAGFTLIEGWPLFDSFYMTLITITTVGYREVHELSHAGRIFNSLVIVFGVTTLFFAIGTMTQSIIELEFGERFERRRTRRAIARLHEHYIVCGFGRVGRAVAAEFLRHGVPFVVMDRQADRVERAIRAGMLAAVADCTRDQSLLEAGVLRARGLVAALGSDTDNLFLIISARTLNPKLGLAARAGSEESEKKLRRAGADKVFALFTEAGHQLTLGLLRPHVLQFLDIASRSLGLDVGLEQILVGESSELASKSLRQARMRSELGVIVLAIRKPTGKMVFNPPADAVLEGGDFLIVMGEQENLRRIEPMLTGVRA